MALDGRVGPGGILADGPNAGKHYLDVVAQTTAPVLNNAFANQMAIMGQTPNATQVQNNPTPAWEQHFPGITTSAPAAAPAPAANPTAGIGGFGQMMQGLKGMGFGNTPSREYFDQNGNRIMADAAWHSFSTGTGQVYDSNGRPITSMQGANGPVGFGQGGQQGGMGGGLGALGMGGMGGMGGSVQAFSPTGHAAALAQAGMGGPQQSPSQNPYLPQITDAMQAQNQFALQQGLNSIRSNSVGVGGLGGSRQGVAEGVATGLAAQGLTGSLANLYGNSWNQDQNRNLQRYGMDQGFYTAQRGQDLQSMGLGAELWNMGLNAPWQPIRNATGTYAPFTGNGTTTTNVNTGGGLQGAIGGAITGATLGRQMNWW